MLLLLIGILSVTLLVFALMLYKLVHNGFKGVPLIAWILIFIILYGVLTMTRDIQL